MLTASSLLKTARLKKKLSRERLGEITKIKPDFIEYIEDAIWDKLPEKPVVIGFVRSIANTLEINSDHVVALIRRDFPDKKLKINPTPDLPNRFTWSPKFTFAVGTALVSIIILGYLLFQYINFLKPPRLIISDPQENQLVKERIITVSGVTDENASLVINNQPVIVNDDGSFRMEIEISKDTLELEAKASARSGKETIVVRKINVVIE